MSKATSEDPLSQYVQERIHEFGGIPASRQAMLCELAAFIKGCQRSGDPALLTFICTHNSRRSHLAQIWATVAAAWYRVEGVEAFSGGTEVTALNPRVGDSLRRAGFEVTAGAGSSNPKYEIVDAERSVKIECFSKVYDQSPNPTSAYCAVMTCSDADAKCPVVQGASKRLPIRYEDPKVADDTPSESQTYDERCRQIGREMMFAFSRLIDR